MLLSALALAAALAAASHPECGVMMVSVGSFRYDLMFAVLLAIMPSFAAAQSNQRGAVPEFGRISDARFLADDRVLVLDETDPRVFYLDGNGRIVSVAGRRGQGPGEYALPERIITIDDSTVAIVDRPNARMDRIRVRRDSIFSIGSIPMHPDVRQGCRLGNALYLTRPDRVQGNRVQEARFDGTIVRSFAPIAYEGPPLLLDTYSESAIGCLDTERLLVLASRVKGSVSAVDVNGTERWSTELPGFRQQRVEALPDGVTQFNWSLDGNSSAYKVIPSGNGRVVVSVLIFWVGPPKDTATTIGARYELDTRTGRVLSSSEGDERVLDIRGTREVVMREEPEPMVVIRTRR